MRIFKPIREEPLAFRKLGFRSYTHYLRSDTWKRRRAQFHRDHPDCGCFLCGVYSTPLQLHHLTYKNLGSEKDGDLVALCEPCHKSLHFAQRALPDLSAFKVLAMLLRRDDLCALLDSRHRVRAFPGCDPTPHVNQHTDTPAQTSEVCHFTPRAKTPAKRATDTPRPGDPRGTAETVREPRSGSLRCRLYR